MSKRARPHMSLSNNCVPAQNTETDPDGPQDGSGRVFRGGSWIVNAARLSVTCRGFERPTNQLDGIGFRIARTAK